MVEMLRELGIRYIALNPGASFRGLHDSLVNFGEGGPEILMCAHEEFAVAMANGYARVTGQPMATGLHNVVGLQHAAMAIFNAWCDRTPMLNLGGGGPQDANHRRSTDWVHTALVQGNLVRDFVKFDDQPYSIKAVPESFLRAYRIAMTEPRGPVYLCLDSDLQEQRIETPAMVPNAALFAPPALPAANPEALQRAADLLVGAQWPVIVAGEVGRNPTTLPALVELAEALAAPVIEAGRFAISNTHPLDLTPRRESVLNQADVVLALDVPSLGVPLGPSVRERGALQPAIGPDTKIIHITLHDLEKQSWVTDNMWMMPVDVPIAADTAQAIPELVRLCRERLMSSAVSMDRVEQRRCRVQALHQEAREEANAWIKRTWDQVPISSARLHGELNQRLKGQPWALAHSHGARWRDVLETTDAAHGLSGGRGAGVGYGLPSSIGAALGWKGSGRLVVSVLGDGDFFMTSNALWTAAKYYIPLLVIIYNNLSYYNDEDHQERIAAWRDRPVENKGIGVRIEDPEPDFASLARSLGAAGFGPITDPTKLGDGLDEAISIVRKGQPAVIDVHTQAR
jgi:thiamine pyrophosphate-dependent acetolactate synthase large subunit-like protein